MGFNKSVSEFTKTYFDTIDTEEKAYILGFILADGCLHKSRNSCILKISLKNTDVNLLERIKLHMKADTNIYISPPRNTAFAIDYVEATFHVCSEYLYNSVGNKIGFTKKTRQIPNITSPLRKDFWRGVIDGDGTIYTKGYHKDLHLAGQMNTLTEFNFFTREYCSAEGTIHQGGGCPIIYFYGSKSFRIIKLLYENSHIFLNRKYDNAMKIINQSPSVNKLTMEV